MISLGGKVKHKIGGPLMIVYMISNDVEGKQNVICTRWWDGSCFQNATLYSWELEYPE